MPGCTNFEYPWHEKLKIEPGGWANSSTKFVFGSVKLVSQKTFSLLDLYVITGTINIEC